MSIEGKVWGWQSHGGDAGEQEEQHGSEAPVPWTLPALEICSQKNFPQLNCRDNTVDNCNSFLLFVDPVKR